LYYYQMVVSSSHLVIAILVAALCVSSVSSSPPANTSPTTQTVYNDCLRFAYFSSAAYLNCSTVQGTAKLQQIISNSGSKTLALILKDDTFKQIIVSFKGSTVEQDFINDADIEPVGYGSPISGAHCLLCLAHKGFYETCWQSVQSTVISTVQTLHNANPSYAVIVTGHSLGGALAPFCALQIKGSLGITPQVYTYGQPRVGNEYFAAFVDSELKNDVFRVTHTDDAVPELIPLEAYLYEHHGTEYYIYQDPSNLSNFVECTGGDETSTCIDGHASWSTAADLFSSNSPHHVYMGVQMGGQCQ